MAYRPCVGVERPSCGTWSVGQAVVEDSRTSAQSSPSRPLRRLILTCLAAFSTLSAVAASNPDCSRLNLPEQLVGPPPMAYVEFCESNPGHCEMSGVQSQIWTPSLTEILSHVNQEVNAEIRYVPDLEWTGDEDRWSYPVKGAGDCEDFALEKRRRLVEAGLPRAAMTMAIAHHRTDGFSHAVLLIETTRGSFVLDQLSAEINCWKDSPFDFEARERPDGQWTRFDQSRWYIPQSAAPTGSDFP